MHTPKTTSGDSLSNARKAFARLNALAGQAQMACDKLDEQLTNQFKKTIGKQASNAGWAGWNAAGWAGLGGIFQLAGRENLAQLAPFASKFSEAHLNKTKINLDGDQQINQRDLGKVQQISDTFRNCINNLWQAYQMMQQTAAAEQKV